MAGTEHPRRPRCRVRSARYLLLSIALYHVITNLQLSGSRLSPSPDDFDRALRMGCEGVYCYHYATLSTGYGSGASVANVFNPLKMPSEPVAPDNKFWVL